ncbi:MAG: hypothetical protein WKG07_13045 [Hymenobacter sp.]
MAVPKKKTSKATGATCAGPTDALAPLASRSRRADRLPPCRTTPILTPGQYRVPPGRQR